MSKRFLEDVFDTTAVALAMQQHCPRHSNSRGKSYQDIAQLYCDLILSQLQCRPRDQYQHRMGLYNLSLYQIRNAMGRYSLQGQKHYWRYWFEQQPFSLYTIIEKGSNMTEQNTIVKLNFDFASADEIEHWQPKQVQQHFPVAEQDIDGYWDTKIDHSSLTAYIKSTQAALNLGNYNKKSQQFVALNSNQTATYQENLKQAQVIRVMSRDSGRLNQAYKFSDFGRIYFKGVNLQNCHKTVRHAAMGDCHSYDFVSASHAWRINECEKIQKGSYAFTRELLENKNIFRRRVAKIIYPEPRHSDRFSESKFNQALEQAKQVLTSIGFGANIEDKPWPCQGGYQLPALNRMLTDLELTRLKNNQWFMLFIQEQEQMNKIIFDYFKKQFNRGQYPKCCLNAGGSLVKNKTLAWLYQNYEVETLKQILSYLEQHHCADNILLIVHDAFYLKNSINLSALHGLLQCSNPYLKIEHTQHRAYQYEDTFGRRDHESRIQLEEIDSLKYQIAKKQHLRWDDNEYASCSKLFRLDYDQQLDQSQWNEQEQKEYQRLRDLYYMDWFKDCIMGNKKWRHSDSYQKFLAEATNIEYSDGSERSDGCYLDYYDGNRRY